MSQKILSARIAILNFNGLELLKECLPSIADAAKASSRTVSVSVIDNCSADQSVDFLRKEFAGVDIFNAKENKILISYNEVLAVFKEEIVILLNNDIKVDLGFVDPLIDPFEHNDHLFAVGSQCLDFDGQGFQGEKSIGGFRGGLFWTDSRYAGYKEDRFKASWTAQVALGAFDRKKFLELGGYDDLYLPGTWEDTDLSLRAYQRGWHCLYEPKSVIFHKGQVSFHKEYGRRESAIVAYRNSFLFVWKNFKGTPWFFWHMIMLPLRLLLAFVAQKKEFLEGFRRAFKMRKEAFSKTPQQQVAGRSLSDVLKIWRCRFTKDLA